MRILIIAAIASTLACSLVAGIVYGITAPDVDRAPGVDRVRTIPDELIEESTAQGLSPHLPMAIAWRESRMNPLAIGVNFDHSHDFGLMQLNDRTVRILHVANPLNVRQNVIAGVGVWKWGLDLCGSERGAMNYYARGRCK